MLKSFLLFYLLFVLQSVFEHFGVLELFETLTLDWVNTQSEAIYALSHPKSWSTVLALPGLQIYQSLLHRLVCFSYKNRSESVK